MIAIDKDMTNKKQSQRFKSSDLVAVGIAQIRARVKNCNPEALDYVASVTEEMGHGRYVDRTINEDIYKKAKGDVSNLIEEFKKNCVCQMK